MSQSPAAYLRALDQTEPPTGENPISVPYSSPWKLWEAEKRLEYLVNWKKKVCDLLPELAAVVEAATECRSEGIRVSEINPSGSAAAIEFLFHSLDQLTAAVAEREG